MKLYIIKGRDGRVIVLVVEKGSEGYSAFVGKGSEGYSAFVGKGSEGYSAFVGKGSEGHSDLRRERK